MSKQLSLQFETIDQLFRRARELEVEKYWLSIAIAEKQDECKHQWGEWVRKEQDDPTVDRYQYENNGWNLPIIVTYHRECKICQARRIYNEKEKEKIDHE